MTNSTLGAFIYANSEVHIFHRDWFVLCTWKHGLIYICLSGSMQFCEFFVELTRIFYEKGDQTTVFLQKTASARTFQAKKIRKNKLLELSSPPYKMGSSVPSF